MAAHIPKLLHFVWLENGLFVTQLNNIQSWAEQNPSYSVILWCRSGSQQAFAERLADSIGIDIQYEEVEVRQAYEELIIKVYRNKDVVFEIHIRGIESLPLLYHSGVFYDKIHFWRGMPTREDVAGLCALYRLGGIYIDMTTAPARQPLPETIIAPRDILLAQSKEEPPELIPALVAAPAQSPKLKTFAEVFAVHKIVGQETPRTYEPDTSDYVLVEHAGGVLRVHDNPHDKADFEMSYRQPPSPPSPKPGGFARFKKLFSRAPKPQEGATSSEAAFSSFPDPAPERKYGNLREDYFNFQWCSYTSQYLTRRWYQEIEVPYSQPTDIREYVFDAQTGCHPVIAYSDLRYVKT